MAVGASMLVGMSLTAPAVLVPGRMLHVVGSDGVLSVAVEDEDVVFDTDVVVVAVVVVEVVLVMVADELEDAVQVFVLEVVLGVVLEVVLVVVLEVLFEEVVVVVMRGNVVAVDGNGTEDVLAALGT